MTALSWSVIVLTATPTSTLTTSVYDSLIESQTILVAQVMVDGKYSVKATKLLNKCWSVSGESLTRSLEVILNGTPSPRALPLLNVIAIYCQEKESLKAVWAERQVCACTLEIYLYRGLYDFFVDRYSVFSVGYIINVKYM